MPLHEYKTQVLLLHSEQSTLDNLSSGFSDRYTVHCATSGSEALNTLGDTPINVIVSAQDLPGMSGLEALREARKRSPEMVGILLAGNSDDELEALVGDQEVFQIVRGNVTGDAISKLVDDATQQVRLMALAESANDTAANVDETSEHIVMETSDNGSTIISDGTGRLPALDPKKVSAAAAVGARSIDVLVLTKDQEFLATIKDSSRGMHTIHYATTLSQADQTIRKHKVGVAVVDAAMVGDKVEQLTQHLRKGSARLVSIVAGRRDDGEMLMDLINRGKVYRFLLKPVSPGRARLAVEASVKHHLEAPDSAFKMKGAASAPVAKPDAKPAAKPAAKPKAMKAPKPEVVKAPAPAPKAAAKTVKEADKKPLAPADPPLGSPEDVALESPLEQGMLGTFGGDDSSFTETVTGLISSVSKKFSSSDDKDQRKDKDKVKGSNESKPAAAEAAPAATAGSGGSLLQNPKILGIAAAAVVIVAGALFWLMSGSDDTAPVEDVPVSVPSVTESDVVFEEPATEPEPAAVDVDALLDEARLARDAGQVFNPYGSNAIELYAAAASAAPGNAVVAAELDAVIEQALSMAETALLETRLDDADAALQRVGTVDPDNGRLPFLTAQLSQMQLRGHLGDARAAIREERFEDATISIGAARSLNLTDTTEIDAVADELSEARSAQQADDVLAKANERLESGDLLSPANDNARYYYELVLINDPGNTAAQQGLNVIASRLILNARTEIDNGNFGAAQDLIDDVRALDPNNSELATTTAALRGAQEEIATQRRLAEERRIAEAEQRAADERAATERQAAAERAAIEAAAAKALADEQAAAKALAEEQAAAAAEQVASPAAADEPGADTATAAGPVDQAGAGATQPTATPPVATIKQASITSLNRTKYVAPKYPRAAQRRNVSGWVDVVFTVTLDGTVRDVDIRNSEPGDTFVSAAIRAVEKWEFEPVFENGVAVERRAGVRMMFALSE